MALALNSRQIWGNTAQLKPSGDQQTAGISLALALAHPVSEPEATVSADSTRGSRICYTIAIINVLFDARFKVTPLLEDPSNFLPFSIPADGANSCPGVSMTGHPYQGKHSEIVQSQLG